jgi:3'(2'), 5'-bisphosphate nucleotidase
MSQNDPDDLDQRLAFATRIARDAGHRLSTLRDSGRWTDPRLLGDVGDQAADGFLRGALLGRFPDDGVLSEETKDAPDRLDRSLVWIVDPLDGTKEFAAGRHDWAVHVGLARDGVPVLGAVALAGIDRMLAACAGSGVELGGVDGDWPQSLRRAGDAAANQPLRLAVSRSHTPDWVDRFGAEMGGLQLVPSGSVGFKIALLLFGKADLYVHKTGLKEWDTCAPEVVARAAGYAVCRFDGGEHRYNAADPRNDEIVVCRPELRDRVLQALRTAGA